MGLTVLLVHGDAGGRELAVLGAQTATDALLFVDVHDAVFIHTHCLVLLRASLIAGMILAVFANIDLGFELIQSAQFHLDTAMAGACYAVMHERTVEFTAGAAYAMAVFIGILNDVIIFHE